MTNKVEKYPAPWNLKGKGYIIVYALNKDFVEKEGDVPEFLKGKFVGGFGALMLVDYEKSNAGPYGEMLFIPGKFKFKNKRLDTISKIYVSTMESVVNGRNNWGIPKERADFKFTKIDEKRENVCVSIEKENVAEFVLKSGKLSFPVSTSLMPFPLVQEYENKYYYTNFYGKGKGQLARIESMKINPKLFPDLSKIKPLIAMRVDPFDITFPESIIENKE